MNIAFNRIEYGQVGLISTKCLQIIRAEKNEKKNKKTEKAIFFCWNKT